MDLEAVLVEGVERAQSVCGIEDVVTGKVRGLSEGEFRVALRSITPIFRKI